MVSTAILFSLLGPKRLAVRLNEMTGVIRTIMKGKGNLRQRLDTTHGQRQRGHGALWINSFIDHLDSVVGR